MDQQQSAACGGQFNLTFERGFFVAAVLVKSYFSNAKAGGPVEIFRKYRQNLFT